MEDLKDMVDKKRLIAEMEDIVSLLTIWGESAYKIEMFINAIGIIKEMSEMEIFDRVTNQTLHKVKGITRGIASAVTEFVKDGCIKHLYDIKALIPHGLLEILHIPGLSPRQIKILHDKMGIESVGDLEWACLEKRVRRINGFCDEDEIRILEEIRRFRKFSQWFLLPDALSFAHQLMATLPEKDGMLFLVGAVARMEEIIRDIDFLYVGGLDLSQLGHALDLKLVSVNEQWGRFEGAGIPVDILKTTEESVESLRVLLTASVPVRRTLATMAAQKGVDLLSTHFSDWDQIFTSLELPPIPPELLYDEWCLDLAKQGGLDRLVKHEDIKGNLHTHTTYSDGLDDIKTLVSHAASIGHRFIGISDHSQSATYAHGLSSNMIKKQSSEIAKISKEFRNITVFHGIESDIRPDGSLDYDENVLERLDFVIASIHSDFDMDKDKMTKRVVTALSHPKCSILAHPTGRTFFGREPYAIDVDLIVQACLHYGVAIEINANPQRLDLDWRHLRKVREMGIVVTINTDSHSVTSFSDMGFGVICARKAGLYKEAILNTWDSEKIRAFFRKEVKGWI